MGQRLILVALTAWLLLVAASFLWNSRQIEAAVKGLAIAEANSSYEKDIVYRRWAAQHGGVYVPPTENTPPNPYLSHLADRDVTTTSGKVLTLINPAYMSRQVNELAAASNGMQSHLTSLQPIRPGNAPDAWERRAMLSFETGAKEAVSLEPMDGGLYLRFMRPMVAEAPCLKCHAVQGYKLGDIRGGLSVTVPFAPYTEIAADQHRTLLWGHGLIGLLGLTVIWVGGRRLQHSKQALLQSLEATERLATEQKRLVSSLGESEAYLRTIIDTEPECVQRLASDGTLLHMNRAGLDMIEADSLDQVLDQKIQRFVMPEYRDAFMALTRNVFAGESGNLVFETQGLRGGRCWLETHAVPLRNAQGQITALLGVARDITARKQAETELEQHRHHLEGLVAQRTAELARTEAKASYILQSSADGLYGVDAEGKITFVNPAACALLGYRPEQVIGHTAHNLFHHSKPDGSPYPVEECPTYGALLLGQEVRVDSEVYWHTDGHPVPVMYAMHPTVEDGKTTGAVISFVDISAQRAAAEAREQAVNEAERLARLRSEFLANMSHEIRTPLNGVLGFADIGSRNYLDTEKARHAFEQILISGKRLLGVVNDILDFSKIEAGKFKIEMTAVDLTEVIKHAVELSRESAQAKRIRLLAKVAPDMPKTFLGDPLRIGQVLLNLLSNAIKFTGTGSVTLSASRDGGTLLFKVTDTGIGMTEEQLGQLFQPFQQGDGSITRKFGGTGLGLAITKRLLELMDGEIRVESQPGVGTTFEFRLPYIPAAPHPAQPTPETAPPKTHKPLAGLSILAAEDEPINRMVLEYVLLDSGAQVVMVANGREAVERVTQDGADAYDVVLMDMQMPEMDGFEATRRILKLAPALPIIGQTAYAMAEEKAKCLNAGMVDHIAKPLDPEALVDLVLQHVAARHGAAEGVRKN